MQTDLLIIGGGSAGCYAAIKAKDENPDLKVTILEKGGNIKRAGTISFGMDGLNVCVVPGVHTVEDWVRHVKRDFSPLCNEEAQWVLAERSFSVLKELESWGMRFRRDERGQYRVGLKGPFQVAYENGYDLKPILAREVRRRGVEVLSHATATRLFRRDGRVAGVGVLDVRRERFYPLSAKAVILAAGGCARLGLPGSGYLFSGFDFPGNAGDAYAMAYHAGARLTGFEFTIGGRTGLFICAKDHHSPLEVMMKYADGQIINACGEVIWDKKARRDSAWIGTREDLHRAESDQVEAGRDPLFMNVSHLAPEEIREAKNIIFTSLRPSLEAFLAQRQLSFENDPIEVSVRPLKLCSGHGATGIVVDTRARTTVDGLYAAGDCAYVPLASLTGAFVFGAIAGREAARYAAQLPLAGVIEDADACAEEYRVLGPLGPGRSLPHPLFEYKLRRIVNEYIDSPRNAGKLAVAARWVERFRTEDVPQLRATDHHELSRTLEVQNILDCVEMVVAAAQERKESRRYGWIGGVHLRSDYPKRDDENWLKYVLIEKDQVTGRPVLSVSATLRSDSREDRHD